MDCPDCGGPLDSYVLDGHEASVCERCGWVGIEADHRGEGVAPESWDDALDRFYERHVTTERRRSDLPPVAAANDEAPAATADDGDVAGLIDEAESTDGGDEGDDTADEHTGDDGSEADAERSGDEKEDEEQEGVDDEREGADEESGDGAASEV